MTLRLLLAAALMLFHGEVRADPVGEFAGVSPMLIIYLAKGPPNSCGPGCDHWIAVEGKVDRAAASHISRFLVAVKDINRPIYFNSPGGSVGQAITIGHMLHSRSVVARVGRTIVTACAAGTEVDDACLKIKTSGVEVEAEISTNRAICNSACSYLFFGATTREVAPDATMAVHSGRLTPGREDASPAMIAALRDRNMGQADLAQGSYLAAMGISHELEDLVETVKFEDAHPLTRAELYRFGIDTRAVVETAWTLEPAGRPYVRKIVTAKKADGATFRTMQWRLFCENKDRARLMFAREFDKDAAGINSVVMVTGSEKPVAFGKAARIGAYDVWNTTIAADAIKAMLTASHLQMAEATPTPDGKTSQALFDIDTAGLEPAWTKLAASCPEVPNSAAATSAAPAQ